MPGLDSPRGALWRRGRIALDGLRLAYDLAGEGRVVLFLSGGPGDGPGYLSPLAEAIGDPGWTRVLPHQRGTGRSPVPPGTALSVDLAVADLEVFARHLGVSRVALVGHGFGANLALLAAGSRPDLVDRVVLVGSAPFDPEATERAGHAVADTLGQGSAGELRDAVAARDRALSAGDWPMLRAALLAIARRRAPLLIAAEGRRELWSRGLDEEFDHDPWTARELARSLAEVDQLAVLNAVRCPVRAICGDHDVESAAALRDLPSLVPGARVTIVDDAGHLAWVDRPDAVLPAVRAALTAADTPSWG